MSEVLFSICIPTRNRAHLIGKALDSCLAQTCRDVEVVVCDNASEDGTVRAVEDYAKRDSRIRLIKNETNVGQTRNIFRAFQRASGSFVQYLADDNWLQENYVEEKVRLFRENPEAGLVSSAFTKYKQTERGLEIFSASHLASGVRSADWVFSNFYKGESYLGIFCSARREDMLEALSALPNVPNRYGYDYVKTDVAYDLMPFLHILSKYRKMIHTDRTRYFDLMTPSEIEDRSVSNLVELRHQTRVGIEHVFFSRGLKKHVPAFRRYLGATLMFEIFRRMLLGPRKGIGFSKLARYFKGYTASDWFGMIMRETIPTFARRTQGWIRKKIKPELELA